MRKEMIVTERHEEDHASMGELISRLTRETTALVKAEAARLKLQASSIVVPAVGIGLMAILGIGTFALGLLGFGVALFAGVQSLTGSAVIGGIVVGAVAWVLAMIAGAICAAMLRAVPLKMKSAGLTSPRRE